METEDIIKKEEDLNANIVKMTEENIAMVESGMQTIGLLKEDYKELHEKLGTEQNAKAAKD